PWSRTYCGNGVLADCRTALWQAMGQAAADLEAEFMSPNVVDWKRQVADDQIEHTTVGITGVHPIHWINRPTFQQVEQLPLVDQFKCNRARPKTASARKTVTLADQFGAPSTLVLKPDSLCNPVGEDGETIADPTAHLACYRIRNAPGQTPFVRQQIGASDEFGTRTVSLLGTRTLCVPSTQDGVPSTLSIDHFKCYKASKASPRFTRRNVQ